MFFLVHILYPDTPSFTNIHMLVSILWNLQPRKISAVLIDPKGILSPWGESDFESRSKPIYSAKLFAECSRNSLPWNQWPGTTLKSCRNLFFFFSGCCFFWQMLIYWLNSQWSKRVQIEEMLLFFCHVSVKDLMWFLVLVNLVVWNPLTGESWHPTPSQTTTNITLFLKQWHVEYIYIYWFYVFVEGECWKFQCRSQVCAGFGWMVFVGAGKGVVHCQ